MKMGPMNKMTHTGITCINNMASLLIEEGRGERREGGRERGREKTRKREERRRGKKAVKNLC